MLHYLAGKIKALTDAASADTPSVLPLRHEPARIPSTVAAASTAPAGTQPTLPPRSMPRNSHDSTHGGHDVRLAAAGPADRAEVRGSERATTHAPSAPPSIDTTHTVRALTPLELADGEASRWFAIQLMLAANQVDPSGRRSI
ncbi:MAG: hypothetical protein ACREPS_07190 [Rhodanobacteraceae bacterium]